MSETHGATTASTSTLTPAQQLFFVRGRLIKRARSSGNWFYWIAGLSMINVFFGFHAGEGRRWAFIIGTVLYALDGLIFLIFGDWLGVAFHLLVLFQLFLGLQALGRLKKLA